MKWEVFITARTTMPGHELFKLRWLIVPASVLGVLAWTISLPQVRVAL